MSNTQAAIESPISAPPVAVEIVTVLALGAVHAVMLALTLIVVSASAIVYAGAAIPDLLTRGARKPKETLPIQCRQATRVDRTHAVAVAARRGIIEL